jgi:hypothetical protein
MNWDTAPQELDDLRAQVAALTKDREQERATTLAQFSAIGKELAAAQTQIAQLREALETISDGENWGEDGCWESSSYPDEIAMEALAAPTDTAALDARLKEERERCAKVCEDQKYMALQPLRTYTAEEVCRSNKVTANYLASAVRRLK